jgi:hypothetical protein
MFHFFHIVFDVLKSQMGAAYVEHAVQTFLILFGERQLAEAIVSGGSTGSRVVERFLSILTFIVSEPGPTFRHWSQPYLLNLDTLSLFFTRLHSFFLGRSRSAINLFFLRRRESTLSSIGIRRQCCGSDPEFSPADLDPYPALIIDRYPCLLIKIRFNIFGEKSFVFKMKFKGYGYKFL